MPTQAASQFTSPDAQPARQVATGDRGAVVVVAAEETEEESCRGKMVADATAIRELRRIVATFILL